MSSLDEMLQEATAMLDDEEAQAQKTLAGQLAMLAGISAIVAVLDLRFPGITAEIETKTKEIFGRLLYK